MERDVIEATPDLGTLESAVPAWLAGADEEEQRELEAMGILADPSFAEEAERDVMASKLLRETHELDTDTERYTAAEAMEHLAITQRYDRLRAPALGQRQRIVAFLLYLAQYAVFTGKKKSRSVGWGTYGRRQAPDKVDITDEAAAIAALQVSHPDLVTVEPAALTYASAQAAISAIHKVVAREELTSDDITALTFVRTILDGGSGAKVKVTKGSVGPLVKANAKLEQPVSLPGLQLIAGEDKPWFEVEPPTVPDNG